MVVDLYCSPVQIGAGLHGTVHELLNPEELFSTGSSPSPCVIKIAPASNPKSVCWEARQYLWCQSQGLTGTHNPDAVLPAFYGHGKLPNDPDSRHFIILERLHGVTVGEIKLSEADVAMAGLRGAVSMLQERASLLHGDVEWRNALFNRETGRVRQLLHLLCIVMSKIFLSVVH